MNEWYELTFRSGYAIMHNFVANWVLREIDSDAEGITMMNVPVKSTEYLADEFAFAMGLLSFFVNIMYFVPLYRLSYRIVNEKESRARESMKMMGMTDTSYWLSWFSYHLFYVTVVSFVSTILLKAGVVQYTSFGYCFAFLWVFGMSLFGYSMVLCPLFDSARAAGSATVFIYYFSGYFDVLVANYNTDYSIRLLCSIFPPVALYRTSEGFSKFESSGYGVNSETSAISYYNYVYNDG